MFLLKGHRIVLNSLGRCCNRSYLTKTHEEIVPKCEAIISKINENDYPRACMLMNDVFFNDPLVRAFNIQHNDENELIMNDLWLGKLRNNLSLKSHPSILETRIFSGVCINSTLSQNSTYEDLKHFYETTESKELKNLFSLWARTIAKPKLTDSNARIFEIAGISVVEREANKGIEEKLIENALEAATRERFRYARVECTNQKTAQLCEQMRFKLMWTTPFVRVKGINPVLCGRYDWVRIYQKDLSGEIVYTPTPTAGGGASKRKHKFEEIKSDE